MKNKPHTIAIAIGCLCIIGAIMLLTKQSGYVLLSIGIATIIITACSALASIDK